MKSSFDRTSAPSGDDPLGRRLTLSLGRFLRFYDDAFRRLVNDRRFRRFFI